jgi:dienelactone hydrolase
MSVPRLAQRSIGLPVRSGETVSGDLAVPAGASGIVVFAHGSGSSRLSSRNRDVAASLQRAGFATLLFDLLTPSEEDRDEVTGALRFDIPFLAQRLRDVMRWVRAQPELAAYPLGLFGASTGAAAALVAAADEGGVGAIVSRGGRPDLARGALERVTAPTLLIVGGLDGPVIDMNRSAFDRLAARDKELVIVPGASHLFEEPGKLEEVARLAADWCERWLARAS